MSTPEAKKPPLFWEEKRPALHEEKPPLVFPEDFPVDTHFISIEDYDGPAPEINSPFERRAPHVFTRTVLYFSNAFKVRSFNVPFPRFIPQEAYVPKTKFNEYKRRLEAHLVYLKTINKRHQSQINNLKLSSAVHSKEFEVLRKYVNELSCELREGLHNLRESRAQVESLKKLVEELTRRVNNMRPVKGRFHVKDVEGLVTLRSRIQTVLGELAYFTSVVSIILTAFGSVGPKHVGPGPCLYESTDKKVDGFLSDNYCRDFNLTLQSCFMNGLAVSSGFSVKNGFVTSNLLMRLMKEKLQATVRTNLVDSVVAKVSIDEVWGPDMKLLVHMGLPNNAKVGVRGLHKYGAFSANLGLNFNPLLYASASVGTKECSVGGFLEMSTFPRIIRRYSAGLTVSDGSIAARISWNKINNHDTSVLKASVHAEVTAETTVVTQFVQNYSTGASRSTFGVEHDVDENTSLKALASCDGSVVAMLKQRLTSRSTLSLCTNFNLQNPQPAPGFGLSFSYGS